VCVCVVQCVCLFVFSNRYYSRLPRKVWGCIPCLFEGVLRCTVCSRFVMMFLNVLMLLLLRTTRTIVHPTRGFIRARGREGETRRRAREGWGEAGVKGGRGKLCGWEGEAFGTCTLRIGVRVRDREKQTATTFHFLFYCCFRICCSKSHSKCRRE